MVLNISIARKSISGFIIFMILIVLSSLWRDLKEDSTPSLGDIIDVVVSFYVYGDR
jgi:hypothetical protein